MKPKLLSQTLSLRFHFILTVSEMSLHLLSHLQHIRTFRRKHSIIQTGNPHMVKPQLPAPVALTPSRQPDWPQPYQTKVQSWQQQRTCCSRLCPSCLRISVRASGSWWARVWTKLVRWTYHQQQMKAVFLFLFCSLRFLFTLTRRRLPSF